MRERNLLGIHQLVIDKLGTGAMRVIGQREIADAVQIRFSGQGIFAELQVGIAQEHTGATTAPQERIFCCINKGGHGLVPFFLLEIDKADAELGPLPLDVVLELLVGKSPEADDSAVVLFFLFVFKTADPQIVGVFLAVAVHFLQQRVHRLDFFRILLRIIAVKSERRLHPQRARLDRIEEELELRNRFLFAFQGTQHHRALFPKHNARSHIERTRREEFLQGIFRRRERRLRLFRHLQGIQNADGIKQSEAVVDFIFRASHLGISDLFGQALRGALHLAKPADCRKGGILVRRSAREQLHVQAFRLLQLLELFQVFRIAVLECRSIVSLRVLFQKRLQRIRMRMVRKRRIRHGGLYTHT